MPDSAADLNWLENKAIRNNVEINDSFIEAFLERVAIRVESGHSVSGSRNYTFLQMTGKIIDDTARSQ